MGPEEHRNAEKSTTFLPEAAERAATQGQGGAEARSASGATGAIGRGRSARDRYRNADGAGGAGRAEPRRARTAALQPIRRPPQLERSSPRASSIATIQRAGP